MIKLGGIDRLSNWRISTMYKSKRLERKKGIIAGVAAGIGDRYNIDPVWIRLLFLLSLVPGGVPGVLLYVVLWILMPKAA
jgi:phage shock protein PspC (stress-responsive transcriptional regulator)